jgi:hypothetical protein
MWDSGGTVPPELGVPRRLIARGHVVRVLGDPTIELEVRAAGCSSRPGPRRVVEAAGVELRM